MILFVDWFELQTISRTPFLSFISFILFVITFEIIEMISMYTLQLKIVDSIIYSGLLLHSDFFNEQNSNQLNLSKQF